MSSAAVGGRSSGLRAALRSGLSLDATAWQPLGALRAAVGVGVPLVAGTLAGQPTDGVIAAAGALTAGVAGYTGIRGRWQLVAATTAGMTLTTFVGSVAAGHAVARVVALAAFGFLAGLVVTLGRSASLIGTQAVIGLAVFGRFPATVPQALGHAGLVAAGGLLQAVLVGLRPPVRFAAERRSVAHALVTLAAQAHAVTRAGSGGPSGAALDEAAQLIERRLDLGDTEGLRGLVDAAGRVRLELSSLVSVRHVEHVEQLTQLAAAWLRRLAQAVEASTAPVTDDGDIAAVVDRLQQARTSAHGYDGAPVRFAAARAAALLGQLRSLDRQAAALAGLRRLRLPAVVASPSPAAIRLGGRAAGVGRRLRLVATDVHGGAFRHAVRLAGTLVVTEVLADRVPWQRGYWMTLTAAVVLKPDYASTLQRGLARVAGTAAGAFAAGLVVDVAHPDDAVTIALITVLAWAAYAVFGASYAVYSLVVSALVVLLLSPTGNGTLATAVGRGASTLVGGALAMVAVVAWPTWERSALPAALSGLMRALSRYADLVLAGYVDPTSVDRRAVAEAADAARRARATAQASLDRAAAEPARVQADVGSASGVLAAASRIVIALHSLRVTLEDTATPLGLPEAEPARAAVVGALEALASPGAVPARAGLRDHQQWLAQAAADESVGGPAGGLRARRLGQLATHLDPLVDSVDTAAHLLGRDDVGGSADAGSVDEADPPEPDVPGPGAGITSAGG